MKIKMKNQDQQIRRLSLYFRKENKRPGIPSYKTNINSADIYLFPKAIEIA